MAIILGSEYSFNPGDSIAYTATESLDSTHIVVAYYNRNTDTVEAKIGVISTNKVITFGNTYSISSSTNCININIAVLDSTHFALTWIDTSNDQNNVVIGTVSSGDVISFGSVYSFDTSTDAEDMDITGLDSTHFVITWLDDSTNDGEAVVGTVSSGDVISFGSKYNFESSTGVAWTQVVAMDSTHFVIVYTDFYYDNNYAIVGTVSSGDVISFGSKYSYNTTSGISYIGLDKLDSSRFIFAWEDYANGKYEMCIGTISSGNVISFGSKYTFDSDTSNIAYVSVAGININKFVISWTDTSNSEAELLLGTVTNGDEITIDDSVILAIGGTAYPSTCMLDTDKFAVSYVNYGNNANETIIGEYAVIINAQATLEGEGLLEASINFTPEVILGSNYDVGGAITVQTSQSAVLDNTHFVSVFSESNTNNLYASIGTISNDDEISFGSNYQVTSAEADTGTLRVESLDSTHFVLTWMDSSTGEGSCVIGTVSGNTISYGSKLYIGSNNNIISLAVVDNTHFAITYSNPSILENYVVVATVSSGNVISLGTPVLYSTGYKYFTDIVKIDTNKLLLTYGIGAYLNNLSQEILVVNITSNDVVNLETPADLSTVGDYKYFNRVTPLNNNTFVVIYEIDHNNGVYETAGRIGAVNGDDTITLYNENTLLDTDTSYMDILKKNETEFYIIWNDYDVITEDGISAFKFELGTPNIINSRASTSINSSSYLNFLKASRISSEYMLITYEDKAVIGTILIDAIFISANLVGTEDLSAVIQIILRIISASLTGTSDLSSIIILIKEILATMTGSADLSAKIDGIISMAVSLQGNADIITQIIQLVDALVNLEGSENLISDIKRIVLIISELTGTSTIEASLILIVLASVIIEGTTSLTASNGKRIKEITNQLNTLIEADERNVVARVNILYLNPLFSDSFNPYSNTEIDTLSDYRDIIDGITNTSYNWFTFGNNLLDGSYHFPPETPTAAYKVGVWSNKASLSDGSMPTDYPEFKYSFDSQIINEFTISGDESTDIILEDYQVTFTAPNGVDTYTINETGNTEYVKNYDIPDFEADDIDIVVSKINKPYTKAKITEASFLTADSYDDSEIISISLLDEVNYESLEEPIGTISANSLYLELINDSNKFDINNPDENVQELLRKNRKITLDLGIQNGENYIWKQAGVYYSDDWEISPESISVSTTGLDRLELLRNSQFRTGTVQQDVSLYDLYEEILLDAGLTSYNYSIESSLNDIILPYSWFGKMSHREALQRLAQTSMVDIFVDKNDIIQIKDVNYGGEIKFIFKDDKTVFSKKYPLSFQKEANRVEVIGKNYVKSDLQTVLNYNKTITIPPESDLSLELEFNTNNVADIQDPDFTTSSGTANYTNYEKYCWGIKILIQNTSTDTDLVITSIEIEGKILELQSQNVEIVEDSEAQQQNGVNKYNYSYELVQGEDNAEALATQLFNYYKQNRFNITLENRGHIGLQLGDKIQYYDYKYDKYISYILMRHTLDWSGALSSVLEGRKVE